MATKPRLTADEHADLGRTLAGIRDELVHRAAQLKTAYPRTGPAATPARKLDAAVHAIDAARSALDSALFREHPDTADTTTYYPHPADRRMTIPQAPAIRCCDGCNASGPTVQQIQHDPWCPL
jgi:hypothetical protein